MSNTPPGVYPPAARAIFPGAQGFAIRDVVGGDLNMYNTTQIYRESVQSTPPRGGGTQETFPDPRHLDTTSSSWEISTMLSRLLRPFWIYPRDANRDYSVSPLDDDSNVPPTKKTSGEVYVYTMLHAGQGLPCWKPRPREPLRAGEGVTPGDVGVFSVEGGFKKIFNLWEDEVAIQGSPAARSYHLPYEIPPKPRVLTNMKELAAWLSHR